MLAEVLHEIVELLDRAKVLAPGELAALHEKIEKAADLATGTKAAGKGTKTDGPAGA